MRDHAGQDVHAGGELVFHQGLAGFLSLDSAKGRSYRASPRDPCLPPHPCGQQRSRSRRQAADDRRDRIAFVTSPTPEAETARDALMRRYGGRRPKQADVIVALGGDGLMLQTLHKFMESGKPIYGMHRGTVGFLMNEYHEDRLRERLTAAEKSVIHPLKMGADRRRRRSPRGSAPSTRSRCSARPTRPRGCASSSTARSGCPELMADGMHGGNAGRLDGLQSLCPGADHPDRLAAARAHADQPVPAAPLARCAVTGRSASSPSRCSKPSKRPVAAVADHDEVPLRSDGGDAARARASRCISCSIPATPSTSAFCASSSGCDAAFAAETISATRIAQSAVKASSARTSHEFGGESMRSPQSEATPRNCDNARLFRKVRLLSYRFRHWRLQWMRCRVICHKKPQGMNYARTSDRVVEVRSATSSRCCLHCQFF